MTLPSFSLSSSAMDEIAHESILGAGRRDVDRFVGRAIAEHRAACGYTQSELAAAASLPVPVLDALESGEIRIRADRMLAIASALGVSIGWFYGVSTPPRALGDAAPPPLVSDAAVQALPGHVRRAVMLLVTGREPVFPGVHAETAPR